MSNTDKLESKSNASPNTLWTSRNHCESPVVLPPTVKTVVYGSKDYLEIDPALRQFPVERRS